MEVYKLFTDGSYSYQKQRAGIGGYLLNSKNKIVFHFHHELNYNRKQHEKISLYLGLLKCKSLGIKNVLCYFDDFSMQKKYSNLLSYVSKDRLDRKINKLKQQFNFIQFIFIPREENIMADKLASLYLTAPLDNCLERKKVTKGILNVKNIEFNSQDKAAIEYTLFYKKYRDFGLFLMYDSHDNLVLKDYVTQSLFNHMLQALDTIEDKSISLNFVGSGEVNQIYMILKRYKEFEGNKKNAYAILNKFEKIYIHKNIDKHIRAHIYSSLIKPEHCHLGVKFSAH